MMANNIRKKLISVQNKLKAPKNQRNKFGNYNYRNCEDILEAVKPLLNKHGLTMIISDLITQVGDRYYIRAEVVLYDVDSDETLTNSAFARESISKKGMDESQITGAASSYARKYALNGMFAIDDTKDADTPEQKNEIEGRTKSNKQKDEKELETQTLLFASLTNELTGVCDVDVRAKEFNDYVFGKTQIANHRQIEELSLDQLKLINDVYKAVVIQKGGTV